MAGQHTPGPWTITGISQNTGDLSIGAGKLRIVVATVTNAASFGEIVAAEVRGRRDLTAPDVLQTQFANGCLIAAAPEMLNALKAALAPLLAADDSLPRIAERRKLVEDAIAKAEGGPA